MWKAAVEFKQWRWDQELRVWRTLPDRIEVVQPLAFKSYDRHTLVPADEVAMKGGEDEVKDFLQAMLDAAWKSGLRPTGFEDHKNELTAVRYHLEDMRALAMSRLPPTISGPIQTEGLKII